MGNRIPYATIVAAKSGNAEAMSEILRHYERYIIIHSMRVLYDEHGNHYEVLDHELRQRIETIFSKTSLNIREFTVHILLKPGLENFEHYSTSV